MSGSTTLCAFQVLPGLHKFGHWLTLWDLYDSTDSEKTMYQWTASNEIKKRTLHSDDIAGIKHIYP